MKFYDRMQLFDSNEILILHEPNLHDLPKIWDIFSPTCTVHAFALQMNPHHFRFIKIFLRKCLRTGSVY